jgi:hypothetical protein
MLTFFGTRSNPQHPRPQALLHGSLFCVTTGKPTTLAAPSQVDGLLSRSRQQ